MVEYQINGVEDEILDNIETRLDIMLKGFAEPLSEHSIHQFYQQAPDNILQAMQPFGYYKPEINSTIRQNGDQWTATFNINPGSEMRISKIDVQLTGAGEYDKHFINFLIQLPLKQGDILLTDKYKRAKEAFFEVAQHTGYVQAKITRSLILIDLDRYTTEITLHFDTGEQFFFGSINFQQNAFDESFLRRFIKIQAGEPYATTDILKLQEDLNRSGYFQQVVINPEIEDPQGQQIPIEISLAPRKSQVYNIGGGYGTDTGMRGIASWDVRHLNRRGHQFRSYLQGSAIQSNIQGQYLIPGFDPTTDQYSIGATGFNLDLPNTQGTAGLLQIASIRSKESWLQILSLNALYERFRIFEEPRTDAFVLYPEINLQLTVADNLMFANQGFRIGMSVLAGSKALLSKINIVEVEAEAKAIYTIEPTNTRFIARGNFGYISTPNLMDVPTSLQLLTGGPETVRGYSYLGLGPGRVLVVLSGEIQQKVFGKWYFAAFYDAGNAFNMDNGMMSLSKNLKRSRGIGIMRETPIGPARAYLAQTINEGKNGLRFVFTFGPDFT